jgi:LCP family protein required for cell wall assembly
MFRDLDDPIPYSAPPGLLDTVRGRGDRMLRRARQVRAIGGAALLVLMVGAVGTLAVVRRDAAIDRVHVIADPSTDGAINVLVVGSDRPLGSHADSMTVVRFRPDGSVGLLSIPRDLVDRGADGTDTRRLSMALEGGLQSMVDGVVRSTGVPIDHIITLDFAGFRDIVDQLGGLRIGVVAPLRDRMVGIDLPASSCMTLDGDATLALVRSRYTEQQLPDGSWSPPDPTGDLGRIGRAQVISQAVLAQLATSRPGPSDLERFSRVLADHAVLDDGLTMRTLLDLARRLLGAGPERTQVDGIPVSNLALPSGATMLQIADPAPILGEYGAEHATADGPVMTTPGRDPNPSATQLTRCR